METTHLPEDVINSYEERLSGRYQDKAQNLKKVALSGRPDALVCVARIPFTTKRAANFLPFSGYVDIVYDPGKYLIGFGKILRSVRTQSDRFQHQEKFTQELAVAFMNDGGAKGVLVRTKAQHVCAGGMYPVMATSVCIGTLTNPEILASGNTLMKYAYA